MKYLVKGYRGDLKQSSVTVTVRASDEKTAKMVAMRDYGFESVEKVYVKEKTFPVPPPDDKHPYQHDGTRRRMNVLK